MISIMGFKFLHGIEKMLFISNEHVLCKFRDGQTVSLNSNGNIKHQNEEVQELFDRRSRIVASQDIEDNNKLVLLEQYDGGPESNLLRYISVRFNEEGDASIEGICEYGF